MENEYATQEDWRNLSVLKKNLEEVGEFIIYNDRNARALGKTLKAILDEKITKEVEKSYKNTHKNHFKHIKYLESIIDELRICKEHYKNKCKNLETKFIYKGNTIS